MVEVVAALIWDKNKFLICQITISAQQKKY